MNSSGMNTAISDTVSEITVKPISRAPRSAASSGDSPSSIWRTMFSIMTMASSTTKPVPMVSAISDRLSSEKPQNHITPKVAISDSGSATPAMMVARMVRRNTSTTSTTSTTLSTSVNCTSWIEARIVSVRSLTTVSVTPTGMARCSRGSSALDALDRFDDVGAGLALDVDDDGRRALIPAADLVVLQPVDDVGDVAQQHRRAVAIGDDQRLVGVDADQADRWPRWCRTGARRRASPWGPATLAPTIGLAHILQADAVGGEPRQIGLDAHRRPDAALDRDAADAADLGQPLRHQRVGEVAEIAERNGRRGERERQHRRVGRVHLRIGRRIGQVRGSVEPAALIAACTSCAAPSMSRPRSNCSVTWLMPNELDEVIIDSDGIWPNCRSSGAVTSAAMVSGLAPGKLRRDLDGREVDLRQRRDRQPPIAEPAAEHHRKSQKRGRDRPPDERRGDAHCCVLEPSLASVAGPDRAAAPPLSAGAAARVAALGRWRRLRRWSASPAAPCGQAREAGGDHALVGVAALGDDGLAPHPAATPSPARTATLLSGCTT